MRSEQMAVDRQSELSIGPRPEDRGEHSRTPFSQSFARLVHGPKPTGPRPEDQVENLTKKREETEKPRLRMGPRPEDRGEPT